MSTYCEVCNQLHDHNIMEHVYKLEEQVSKLTKKDSEESNLEYPDTSSIATLIEAEKLKARLVELDLLEQAINDGARLFKIGGLREYKLERLKDLTDRLDSLN